MDFLLANLDGNLYAADDTCTHANCSLSAGELVDSNVMCPCHGAEFNLRTGHVEVGPALEPIRIYPVRTMGDDVEIGIPEAP